MRKVLSAVIVFISLTSSLFAIQNVEIAVLAFRSKADTLKEWTPTAQYLTHAIPGYTFHIIPMDYPQMREAAAKGNVDFIITNSGHYIYLEKLYNISRIATMMKYKNGLWLDRFGGVIFTRSDAPPVHSLNDLKSKTIAAVDSDSLGGYAVQMYEFFGSGLAKKDFSFLFTGMPHDNAVDAVLTGKADIGFVRTGVLEGMIKEGKLDLKTIRIIGEKKDSGFPYIVSTALVPEWPISRMPHTDKLLADKVVVALLSQTRSSSVIEGSLGWTAPLEYRGIHTMYEALQFPPYDRPHVFDLSDVYERYQWFILSIALLSIVLIIETLREFRLRQKLQTLLEEKTKAEAETKLAAMVYENNSDAIVISDAEPPGHIISVNPAFEKLTGYSIDDIRGKPTNLLHSGHHDKAFYDIMWNSINTTGSWEGEIIDRHQDGHLFSKWLTIRTINDNFQHPFRRIAIFSDFTDHKEAQQKIWYQANFDLLTSLPNRSMFMYRLEKELHDIERTQQPLTLMFLDLDNFKEVNDTLGHDDGDLLLKEAARRITQCIRKNDIVSRLGGDEFTILLPGTGNHHAIGKIADSLLHELSHPFDLAGEKAFISVSIGITIAPEDGMSGEVLLKNADQAMYSAKNNGRNQYHYFTSKMQDAINNRRSMINLMRDAIIQQSFILHYQPILDLETDTIHKAEALIRWQSNNGTVISPADFIPLAEETGMIIEIGSWVLETAAAQLKTWREKFDPTFQISVNVSPMQFRNDNVEILEKFKSIEASGLPSNAIVIEITEGVLIEQTDTISSIVNEFLQNGITLSIDDFGTGYSSLAYLKKFDVDFLKIDQTFVRNLEEDEDNRILCSAITTMAHQLGIRVVAEGVETLMQLDYLRSIQCDYIQGYYVARPLPADLFEERIFSPSDSVI